MRRLPGMCAGTVAALLLFTGSASAQIVAMTATLTGGEETPAINTGMVGTAEVSVDVAAKELSVTLRVFNIPTLATAGHIHIGPRGPAGPVVIDFIGITGRTGDIALEFRIGEAQFHARPEIGIRTMEDAIQAIINGNAYANVHTQQYPGGEIRGQLTLVRQ